MPDESVPGLEHLVNQIAHDVRNHAFTIGLQAEMGQRRCASSPEVQAHFDSILHQIDGLKKYLDALLLYGRPVKLALAEVDPAGIARERVDVVRVGRGGATPAPVRVETDGPVGRALWDARAVGHAVHAVLDNAIRSASPAPEVVVAVRADDAWVTIEVRDAGDGIPADVLPRLAQPMAVRRAGSPGLGLAIARKIAHAHGGRVEMESSGRGTTVRLILPRRAAPPA